MNIRLSVIVQQQAELFARWTENSFLQANNFTDAKALIQPYLEALNDTHGLQTIPVKYRMADVDNFRNVLQSNLTFLVTAPSGSVQDSDYFNTAVLVKGTTTTGKFVRWWIRSIYDGAVDRGGILQTGGLWYKQFQKYAATLVGTAFKARVRAATAPQAITGIDIPTGTVTAPGHNFIVGNLIHLYRVRGVQYLQKTWQVASVTTNTFTLAHYNQALATGTLQVNSPYARLVSYTYEGFSKVEAVRATAHETARPLDRLPGKRTTRR